METKKWNIVSSDSAKDAPTPRYCAAFSFYNNALYLFGGRSRRYPKQNYNDLWKFDLLKNEWVCIQGNRLPHIYDESALYPAYHAKSSVATIKNYLYLWGGEGISGHVSDFWRLDMQAQEWEMISKARADDPKFW